VTDRENLEASGELFCRLVEEAHARGIRVILDGVFNHCGSFHRWMDRERIYEGRRFRFLQRWEKEKLVQTLANQYRIPPATLAERLDLPVYLVGQMIRSKRNR
jgi:maltooligosyltrehalose synthase